MSTMLSTVNSDVLEIFFGRAKGAGGSLPLGLYEQMESGGIRRSMPSR